MMQKRRAGFLSIDEVHSELCVALAILEADQSVTRLQDERP
jgi:hypothetical protein